MSHLWWLSPVVCLNRSGKFAPLLTKSAKNGNFGHPQANLFFKGSPGFNAQNLRGFGRIESTVFKNRPQAIKAACEHWPGGVTWIRSTIVPLPSS
jgi:hypothetical protein